MVSKQFKWKSDFDKSVIMENYEERNWIPCNGDGTTNINKYTTHPIDKLLSI